MLGEEHDLADAAGQLCCVVGGQPGYYPVRALSDIFLWLNPTLGDLLDSTNLSNGLHTIQLDFVNGAGTVIETSTPLTIPTTLVLQHWDRPMSAVLSLPTRSAVSSNTGRPALHP